MNHQANRLARAAGAAAVVAVLGFAGNAGAHIATAEGNCRSGLSWSATNYDKTVVNSITASVDGGVVHQDLDFKASDVGSHPTDPTKPHTWAVDVNAPGTQWDHHLTGSYPACQDGQVTTTTAAPTTTTTTTTTVAATTTTAASTTTAAVTTTVTPITTTQTPQPPSAPRQAALPATGPSLPTLPALAVTLAVLAAGSSLVYAARRHR